mgnify:CR=1 FL=1
MRIEAAEKCLARESPEVLGFNLGKSPDFKWGYKGYNCKCNKHNRLGCRKEEGWICNLVDCSGDCDYSEKRRYSFPGKYIGAQDIYAMVPENIADEFVGGLVLDKGRVEKITVGRELTKHIDGEKLKQIIAILTCRDWRVIKKVKEMSDYLAELREKSVKVPDFSDTDMRKSLGKKYDELFGDADLKYGQYDDETLKKFWNVYKAIISGSPGKKYFSEARKVFMNFRKRNAYERMEGGEFKIFLKEFFSLCVSAGDFSLARALKKEYPDALENEFVPSAP